METIFEYKGHKSAISEHDAYNKFCESYKILIDKINKLIKRKRKANTIWKIIFLQECIETLEECFI